MFSPAYASTRVMYERSRRSVKSATNSARSSAERAAQWRESVRRVTSSKSKSSRASLRISYAVFCLKKKKNTDSKTPHAGAKHHRTHPYTHVQRTRDHS